MHDAGLNRGLREHRGDRVGEARQTVDQFRHDRFAVGRRYQITTTTGCTQGLPWSPGWSVTYCAEMRSSKPSRRRSPFGTIAARRCRCGRAERSEWPRPCCRTTSTTPQPNSASAAVSEAPPQDETSIPSKPSTGSRPQRPQRCASTSSATTASPLAGDTKSQPCTQGLPCWSVTYCAEIRASGGSDQIRARAAAQPPRPLRRQPPSEAPPQDETSIPSKP